MEQQILNIIIEMFSQRKYTNIDINENYIRANKPCGNKIYAFNKVIEKLNVSEIQNCMSILQREQCDHGLIIYQGTPTSVVKVIISNMEELKIDIELFNASDLKFNITKHILVPKHEALSKEETIEFKIKYGTSIPVLLKTDPICKFYNFSKGEIIRVIRRDGFISFRIVK